MQTIRINKISDMILYGAMEELIDAPNGVTFRCKYIMKGALVRELVEFQEQLINFQAKHKIDDNQDYFFYLTGEIDPASYAILGYRYSIVDLSGRIQTSLTSEFVNSFTLILEKNDGRIPIYS